jgi:hypothetical protein
MRIFSQQLANLAILSFERDCQPMSLSALIQPYGDHGTILKPADFCRELSIKHKRAICLIQGS